MQNLQSNTGTRETSWSSWFVPPLVIPLAACLLIFISAIVRFGM
jgi:hypothetical protein